MDEAAFGEGLHRLHLTLLPNVTKKDVATDVDADAAPGCHLRLILSPHQLRQVRSVSLLFTYLVVTRSHRTPVDWLQHATRSHSRPVTRTPQRQGMCSLTNPVRRGPSTPAVVPVPAPHGELPLAAGVSSVAAVPESPPYACRSTALTV